MQRVFQTEDDFLLPGQQLLRANEEPSPERRLLLAVLRGALLDAIAMPLCRDERSAAERELDRQEALAWIQSDEEHAYSFVFVCDHLGVTPECMRRAILERLANGTLVIPRADPAEPHHEPDAPAMRAA
jgi:hypothetical protein